MASASTSGSTPTETACSTPGKFSTPPTSATGRVAPLAAPAPRAPSSASTRRLGGACSDHSVGLQQLRRVRQRLQAGQSCPRRLRRPASTCPSGTFICPTQRLPRRLLRPLRRSQQLWRLRQCLSGHPVLHRRRLRRPCQHLPLRHLHLPQPKRLPRPLLRPLRRSQQLRRLRQRLSGHPVLHRRRLRRPCQHLPLRHLHLPQPKRLRRPLLRPLRRSQQLRRLRQRLSGHPVLHRRRLRRPCQHLPLRHLHLPQPKRLRRPLLRPLRRFGSNCGACGNACQATQSCTAGVCVDPASTCPSGTFICLNPNGSAGPCSDHSADRSNCGACGNACQATQSCTAGVCVDPASTCPSGTFICLNPNGSAGPCSDHSADRSNCGACGNACQATQSCQSGVCQ